MCKKSTKMKKNNVEDYTPSKNGRFRTKNGQKSKRISTRSSINKEIQNELFREVSVGRQLVLQNIGSHNSDDLLYHNRKNQIAQEFFQMSYSLKKPQMNQYSSSKTSKPQQTSNHQLVQSIQTLIFSKTYLREKQIFPICNNLVVKNRGHNTIVFSHPIIEGSYYLEVKIENSFQDLSPDTKYMPNVRMGMCDPNHPSDLPIGIKNSYGYNFIKHAFVKDGKKIANQGASKVQKLKQGDILAMQVYFPPPDMRTNSQQMLRSQWVGSFIKFFYNGQELGCLNGVQKKYYVISVSLFNCPFVRLNVQEKQMRFLPNGCLAYENISKYKCPYRQQSLNLPPSVTKILKFQSPALKK